jgi:hypothetical protein
MASRAAPEVPLRAGIGPENPPCPVCGAPLFGWAVESATGAPVRRCEVCGLGVVGQPGDRDEVRAALERELSTGAVPNRAGLSAWLGESGWAAISPRRRYLFTPAAAARLGTRPSRPRAAPALMWQTILNSFTFGHDVALGRLGRADAVPAPRPWQRRLDAVVTILASPLVALVALALEGIATLAGRGGSFRRA